MYLVIKYGVQKFAKLFCQNLNTKAAKTYANVTLNIEYDVMGNSKMFEASRYRNPIRLLAGPHRRAVITG